MGNTITLDEDEYRAALGEDHEDFELIEESEWTQDYKYQNMDVIVKHIPTGKFYEGGVSRSGSPFTDWEYDYGDCTLYEVKRVTETITREVWKAV